MATFASSAATCGLLTTWLATSRKRSSNHPGQVPGNQLRYSPANSESGGNIGRLLEVRGTPTGATRGANYAEASGSVSYLFDDVFGVWPVHFEVSSGHDH